MKLIVCLDDRGGMLFNKRRVSSDRVVTEKVKELCREQKLFVTPYTYKLFAAEENVICTEEPFSAAIDHWYFAEDRDVSCLLPLVEQVVIFYWNRTYPADLYFPVEKVRNDWKRICSEEFCGHSHQRITMEVYSR